MRIPITQAVTENCEKIAENCGDIAALQAKTLQTAIQPRTVYSISDTPRGFTWERWGPRAGSQDGDLAGFDAQWGGPEVDGIPTHTDGAPTTSGVETDTRYSPSDTGQDEHRLCYWVYNDRAVSIEVQDIDTRAESVRVYAGCDCPSSLVHERYQIGGGTPYHSQGDKFLTVPPGGLVKMTVLIHDPGPDASGFRPLANEVGSTDTFLPRTHQERITVECRIVEDDACNRYELADGESWHPIAMNCLDCGGGGEGPAGADGAQGPIGPAGPAGQDGLQAPLSNAQPIPDNETDTAIRTGSAGTSGDVSRADHNHRIVRQSNPGDPVITVAGSFELQANLILDRWSDEESYSYAFRTLVNQPAGTGWGYIIVPSIAGFQRPRITGIGSYRFASTAVQEDEPGGAGGDGAGPRGPYMGKEVHHWSSTQRLYGAYFRRDNNYRAYIEYVVEYTRT